MSVHLPARPYIIANSTIQFLFKMMHVSSNIEAVVESHGSFRMFYLI